jgi:site-specific DNA-methyltransferase (adenine-specific)
VELNGDPDYVPEAQEQAITSEGDLWLLGDHRLLCGDSTKEEDVGRLMAGKTADMVHTDPPYNIDYTGGSKLREKIENDKLDNFNEFLISVYKNISNSLVNGGAIYVWHASSESYYFVSEYLKTDLLFKSLIVWNKNNSTFGRSDYHWKHELCIYGWKSGSSHKWFGDRKQTTVWDIDRPSRSEEHPTMKPVDLCIKAITNSSDKNMIVLDVFGGSGSTLIACEQTNRKCFMMELDPKYCDVIIRRWQDLTGKEAVKEDGIKFNDITDIPW